MSVINVYHGIPGGKVTVNGVDLNPRLDIVNHSPDGFQWGYEGSGPAQLALAMMIHEFGEDIESHPKHYQNFKRDIVALFRKDAEFAWNSEQFQMWLTADQRVLEIGKLIMSIIRSVEKGILEELLEDNEFNSEHEYTDIRKFPNGRNAGIAKFIYTHAIVADLDKSGYAERWCYNSYVEAYGALQDWNGEGDPEGWHRHIPSGRRRDENGNDLGAW